MALPAFTTSLNGSSTPIREGLHIMPDLYKKAFGEI
jgi:hypothetical protein